MTKKQMTALVESMVAEIEALHGGAFDGNGARAMLGAALRAQRPALVRYGLGSPMVAAAHELQETSPVTVTA